MTGDPLQETTDFGHMIDKLSVSKVLSYINQVPKSKLWHSPIKARELNHNLLYIPPTLVENISDDSIVAQEEIFGPVLTILDPYNELSETMPRVNNSIYGLAAGIFTNQAHELELFSEGVDAGIIWHNTWNICPPSVPFKGFKQSGLGSGELGREAILGFSKHTRIVVSDEYTN